MAKDDMPAERSADRQTDGTEHSADTTEGTAAQTERQDQQPQTRKAAAAALRGSAIPDRAKEDDPRAWGDNREDRDAWLKEQRPPHWS